MLKTNLQEKKLETLLFKLRLHIPSHYIFAFLGLLQAAVFYAVDQQMLPTFIRAVHTDKIIFLYCTLIMLCYNDKKTIRLFFTSALGCLAVFTPISQYHILELHDIGYAHHDTMYSMLILLYPVVCSVNYYYHHYGLRFSNVGNQAYNAFWIPIINLLTVLFYLIISLTTLFFCIFLTKIIGTGILWKELTDITLIKIYAPLLFSALCWLVYKHADASGNILRGFAHLAHYLYWIVAPIGLLLILSQCFVIVQHGAIPDFNYRPMFIYTFMSVLLFHLSNYPDESYAKSNPIFDSITRYYNSLLPLIPLTYLSQIVTNFTERSGDLACNATLLETGLNLGNFAPLLASLSLLYLTAVQAYYTHQSKEIMLLRLAKDSWWLCLAFMLICLIAYNPFFSIKPDYTHYLEHCHHFTSSDSAAPHTRATRYIA